MKNKGSNRDLVLGVEEAGVPPPGPSMEARYVALDDVAVHERVQRSFGTALRQLWHRRWLIAVVTAAGAAAMVGVAAWLPALYVGEARLLVGVPAPRVLNVQSVIADIAPDNERVQNEIQMLQSRSLARDVIARLRLAGNRAFDPAASAPPAFPAFAATLKLPEWLTGLVQEVRPSASAPSPSPAAAASRHEDRLVDLLLSRIDVASVGRSHVLAVKAMAPDAELAAAIANTLVEAYLDGQRRDKVQTMERVDRFLTDRIAELRGEVERADRAVEDYRRLHGLYRTGSSGVTNQQLAELNSQLTVAQTARVEAEERLREAQGLRREAVAHETVPEVLRSPLIAALKQQQADVDRRAAEAAAQYGPSHPRLQGARAEQASLAGRVADEVGRVVDGLARDARTAEARHVALRDEFERLKARLGVVNDKSIQLEALERDATVHRNLLEAMLGRARQAATIAPVVQPNGRLVSAAVPAERPGYPPRTLLIVAGTLVALLVGCLLALVLEGADRTFRKPGEVELDTGLPVLALVPQVRSAVHRILRQPGSAYVEALRRLFLGVELTGGAQPPRSVLFTSAAPGEGKSVMVASLARLLARSGKRVLAVDCDWRRPRLHSLFRGCGNKVGIHELLSDPRAVLNDCVQRDAASGADLIAAGHWNPGAAHLLHSGRMRELLQLLSASYDVVLIDCPPVLVTADALALSRLSDKVVYVVRWGHTARETAGDALKQLLDCQADVAGIAISRVVTGEYRRYASRVGYARRPLVSFR